MMNSSKKRINGRRQHEHFLYHRWKHINSVARKPWYRGYEGCYCDWDNFWDFAQDILEHLGPPPEPNYRLARKTIRQGYRLNNMIWEQGQAVVTRHWGLKLRLGREILSLQQLAERAGISRNAAYLKLRRGQTPREIVRA